MMTLSTFIAHDSFHLNIQCAEAGVGVWVCVCGGGGGALRKEIEWKSY